MRIERVRRPQHQVLAELQAHTGRRRSDTFIQFARPLRAAELHRAIGDAVAAFLRHVGIELERVPVDGEVQPLGCQQRQRTFELSLADIAPRADRIGDDVDTGTNRCRGVTRAVRYAAVHCSHSSVLRPTWASATRDSSRIRAHDGMVSGIRAIGSGRCPETRPGRCPRDPHQRRSLWNPILLITGSKGSALGGVQRRSLWSGFGVKPRALLRIRFTCHMPALVRKSTIRRNGAARHAEQEERP